MALDREDIEKLENHEVRLQALEKGGVSNRQYIMWLVALAVQGGILYAALRH